MSDYIRREDALKKCCEGCNVEYPEMPCEPGDCAVRSALLSVPAAFTDAQIGEFYEIVPETTTEIKSCTTCRFYELRERYEREPHNKLEPYCKLNCRWIGNTGKCGEWMAKDGKS